MRQDPLRYAYVSVLAFDRVREMFDPSELIEDNLQAHRLADYTILSATMLFLASGGLLRICAGLLRPKNVLEKPSKIVVCTGNRHRNRFRCSVGRGRRVARLYRHTLQCIATVQSAGTEEEWQWPGTGLSDG